MRKRIDPVTRFFKYVLRGQSADDCWLWRGQRYSNGYASFWDGSRKVSAFAFSYRALVGPIPAGYEVHHICGVRLCVSPLHLQLATHQENMRLRGIASRQPDVPRRTTADRFWSFVDKSGDCWVWTGCVRSGYGRFSVSGHLVTAHRFSYELANGPIPDGMQIDHLCKNTLCVRPDGHLEAVSQYENNMRSDSPAGLHARKTHCPRGHAFDEHGVVNTRGSRECSICRRDFAREYARARRALKPRKARARNSNVCLSGHELTLENTRTHGNGARTCRRCYNDKRQLLRFRQRYPLADFTHKQESYGLLI